MHKLIDETVDMLHEKMKQSLTYVADKYDVTIEKGQVSFDAVKGVFSFTVQLNNPAKDALTTEQAVYEVMCKKYNLPKRDTVIKLTSGRDYIVIGWNKAAHKYPVILQDVKTGTEYKTSLDSVLNRSF